MASNKAKATIAAPEPAPTTEGESPKCSGEKNIGLTNGKSSRPYSTK